MKEILVQMENSVTVNQKLCYKDLCIIFVYYCVYILLTLCTINVQSMRSTMIKTNDLIIQVGLPTGVSSPLNGCCLNEPKGVQSRELLFWKLGWCVEPCDWLIVVQKRTFWRLLRIAWRDQCFGNVATSNHLMWDVIGMMLWSLKTYEVIRCI